MRVAADPDFTFKLATECGVDALIIITVNLLARRQKFFTELEFVLSQVPPPCTYHLLNVLWYLTHCKL